MQNLNKLQTPEEKFDFLFKKYAELVRSLFSPFARKIYALVRAEKRRLLAFQVHHYRRWLVPSGKSKSEFTKAEFLKRKERSRKTEE